MRYLTIAAVAVMLSACATHHDHHNHDQVVSKGNLTAISVEAPEGTSQEALNKALYKVAALETVKAGYDKFEVVDNSAWKSGGPDAARMRAFETKHMANGNDSSKINIRMYHFNDASSENAVDARSYLPADPRPAAVVKKTVAAHK